MREQVPEHSTQHTGGAGVGPKLQDALASRSRRMQIGAEIAQEIADVSRPEELYRRLVALVKERFGYYHVQLFRHDPQWNAMVLVEGYGGAGERMKATGHRVPFGRGVVGVAAATGEPVLATDLLRDSYWVPHPELLETKGELAVPIKLRDRVFAVLSVQADTAGWLSEEDQVVLLSLAGQVSIVVHGLLQLQETRTRARREQTLREITDRMRTFTDPDALAQIAVRGLGTALGRPVFIRLGSAEELSQPPGERHPGQTGQ